jgi:tripartite-type tricarboxylate transporter receptor subunit TctC
VRKVNGDVNRMLAQKDVIDRFTSLGAEPAPMTPEQFGQIMRADMVKWAKVVKDSGATLD